MPCVTLEMIPVHLMSPQYCQPLIPKQADSVKSKFLVNPGYSHHPRGHEWTLMLVSPAGKLRFESLVPLS